VDRLHARQDNKEYREEYQAILDWLTPIDYAPQQSDFIARRQRGTGRWLTDSDEFQAWVSQKKQTLFCQGMPGAGKTILTSHVVDHLEAKFQNEASTGIAYLYCNFRRQHEQKPSNLLESILKQLVQEQSTVLESVKSLYSRHTTIKRSRPLVEEISKVLRSVVANYSRCFILVDALDECQISDGGRKQFLSEIFDLQIQTGVNLFATSRFIPDIEKHFEGSISLEIRASDEDVERYIDGHMSRLPLFVSRSPDLQDKVKTEIIMAVDGMHLSYSTRMGLVKLTFWLGSSSPSFI
jgi:Cdc6-like AAA superfamily ATPase